MGRKDCCPLLLKPGQPKAPEACKQQKETQKKLGSLRVNKVSPKSNSTEQLISFEMFPG